MDYRQPIIRGIEAVGAVRIKYKYNGDKLVLPTNLMQLGGKSTTDANTIDTTNWIDLAGFRLDSNFLRASPQIASSFMIPILGGGAVALTNNNRSGTLTINCTRVSTPATDSAQDQEIGAMYKPAGQAIGPLSASEVYDLVFIAQAQQSQEGGDSLGSTIQVLFDFCGLTTVVEFQGCTIASVDPLGLSGNDAVDYGVTINYLNWTANYSSETQTAVTS